MSRVWPCLLSGFVMLLTAAACSAPPVTLLFSSKSPDGQYTANLYFQEEGTLGSSRYRLELVRASDGNRATVFSGQNAWAEMPIWENPATLVLPFCFGAIDSVTSIVNEDTGHAVKFRTSTSSNIRIHIVTSPDTTVSGKAYCSSAEMLRRGT